jgi:hypothetical protein
MMDISMHENISRKHIEKSDNRFPYLKMLILAVVVTGLVVLIFFSGSWRDVRNLKDVKLIGNTTLTKEELFSFARLNDSLICSGSLSLQIIEERLSKHPDIQSVNASTVSGDLIIDITEKNPFAMIIRTGESPLMVDDKLNLYNYKKEHKNIDVPVISGLSENIDITNVSKEDHIRLKIAQYIIGKANNINRMLFKFISEISFRDTSCLLLYCGDNAAKVLLVEYSSLRDIRYFINDPDVRKYSVILDMDQYQLVNIKNDLFRTVLDEKLVLLNGFLRKVLPYKDQNAYNCIDLRYRGSIIVRNN